MQPRLRAYATKLSLLATAVALTVSTAQPAFAEPGTDAPPVQVETVETPTPNPDLGTTPETGTEEPSEPEAPETPVVFTPGTVAVVGTPSLGSVLRAETTDWEPAATLTFQWLRNGEAIPDATTDSLTVSAADAGTEIKLAVTATMDGAEPVTLESDPVLVPQLIASATPKVAGTFLVGKTLTATPGNWTTGTAFTYQWLRNGKPISGATKATYTLASADGGAKLAVSVTGTRSGYTTAKTTSSEKLVLRVMTASTPKFSGTVKVGSTLKVSAGKWTTGTKLSYRWLRNGAAITGGTKASYKLTSKDAGKKISVRITGAKTGYQSVTKTSTTKKVPLVLRAATPKISGSAILGRTLTLQRGTWTSKTSFQYRWLRNGAPIKGATKTTYRIKPTDVGARFSVRVKGTRNGHASEVRTSARTATAQRPAPVLWHQTDQRWANVRVGNGLIGPTGCVPTAMAMALWSAGSNPTPLSVARVMNQRGDYNRGAQGAGSKSIVAAGKYFGVPTAPIKSHAALNSALRSGKTVVALLRGPSSVTFPGSTHAVTLRGLSGGGSTFLSNPYGSATSTWYNTSTVWSYQSYDAMDRNAGAVFWAIG